MRCEPDSVLDYSSSRPRSEPKTARPISSSRAVALSSSLSREWTDAVRASGRFEEFDWDRRQAVRVTTLDALIETYGAPDFCKIDVEGYELEVLRGLSRPLPALSFEFTVERLESRIAAAEHVARLGMGSFNYSPGESMRLALDQWIDLEGVIRFLRDPTHTPATFGDVYVRTAA